MSIKKLNDANPTAKRPLRVEDLQDIWSGLCGALAQYGTPHIISGLDISSSGFLTAGCIAYQGDLYFYDGESNIQEGSRLYVARVPDNDDMRTLSDGTIQPFSYLNIITADSSLTGAAYIGEALRANLNSWRAPFIPDGFINSDKLADGSVASNKLSKGLQPVSYAPYTIAPDVPTQNIFGVLRNDDYGWVAPILDIPRDSYTRTLTCQNTSQSPTVYTDRPMAFDIPVRIAGQGTLVVSYDTPFGVSRRLTINASVASTQKECILKLVRYDATKGYSVIGYTNFSSNQLSFVDEAL